MALLTAGYFQTTYFAKDYFQDDYWPEYGAAFAGQLLTAGYWPTAYFPKACWADDYWPNYGTGAFSGTLLTPGYFPDIYFPESMWADDYWPDYGYVAPIAPEVVLPPTAAPTGGAGLTLQPDYRPGKDKRKQILLDDEELLEIAGYIVALGILK